MPPKALFRLFCVDRDAASTLEAAGELKEELSGAEMELRKRRLGPYMIQ